MACFVLAFQGAGLSCQAQEIADPFEPVNRVIFRINMGLDKVILRPAATVYTGVTPSYVQGGIQGVLSNLKEPVTFLSLCAQGKPAEGLKTLMRFVVNTVFGLGGFMHLGESLGMDSPPQTFAHALGAWGIRQGPYLMLPVLGPSSARDLAGKGVWWVADPLTRITPKKLRMRNTLVWTAADLVDIRARNLVAFASLEKTSPDLYVTIRSLFSQKTAVPVDGILKDSEGPQPEDIL